MNEIALRIPRYYIYVENYAQSTHNFDSKHQSPLSQKLVKKEHNLWKMDSKLKGLSKYKKLYAVYKAQKNQTTKVAVTPLWIEKNKSSSR